MTNRRLKESLPGDLLYSSKPFVYVIRRLHWRDLCENCFHRSYTLKSCKACGVTKYCSRKCQSAAWDDHKLVCLRLKYLPDEKYLNEAMVHLIGKLTLKIKGKDWTTISDPVGKKKYTFNDLNSHKSKITQSARLTLEFKEIQNLVMHFIGEENMPSKEQLIAVYGKVKYNQHSITHDRCLPYGNALFIGAAKCEHSCIPNAVSSYMGNVLQIRALKRIESNREKITLCIFPMVFGYSVTSKSETVKKGRLGRCKCSDCSLPFGKSILTKVTDETRAYSIIQETECLLKLNDTANTLEYTAPLREAVKDLLKRQEGVLGNTNLLRMRLLEANCSYEENYSEKIKILEELLDCMTEAFGENFPELITIYQKLVECYLLIDDLKMSFKYAVLLSRLQLLIYGKFVV